MVLDVCRSLWNQCLLFLLLETTTKSMITLFGRANSQLLFFNVVTTIQLWISASDQQEPACCVCKNLHQQKWLTTTTAKMHHPLSHCTHIHCLDSINVHKHWWISVGAIFSMEEFSATPSLHMHFHVRHRSVRLFSVALCHMATKCSGILVSMFILYCHNTIIHLWYHGPT